MITLTDTKAFKNVLRMIRKISKEAGVMVESGKLSIAAISPSNVAFLELSREFEGEKMMFGIEDVSVLERLLPDTGEAYIELSNNTLRLEVSSKRKKALELKVGEYNRISLEYDPINRFRIPSDLISEIVEDAGAIADYIDISLSPERVVFGAQNQYATTKYSIDITPEISDMNIRDTFHSKVLIGYLKILGEANGDITIRMNPGKPLLSEFKYHGFDGKLYIAIAGE
ncbi:MAG: hypothetical protein NZ908_00165 [Candidatus Micrarchaeota archaeon]|nr:hypothetical protein [Candidatus Micrarchaeota archaeon]MCX8154217.1 hypothetical protein [Candidatus Micrarchaeota archaeon]